MVIAIDFDGTIVSDDRRFDDVWSPFKLKPGVKEALLSLKRAGHVLVLWSARNNRARQYLPEFDPLVRAGKAVEVDSDASRKLHADRWRQMLTFIAAEFPGVFDAIDDGRQGKIHADIVIDDRAVRLGPGGETWQSIASIYGE